MFRIYQKIMNSQIYRKLNSRKLQVESKFYNDNRSIVLDHYRYLLKTVPNLYQRKLQQRSIYIQITHLFHRSKVLLSIEQTKSRTKHLSKLVEDIKKGDYGNIGIYLPARRGEKMWFRDFQFYKKNRLE